MLREYETMIVIDYSIGEEQVQGVIEKFKSLIEKNATFESMDIWGRRRLAYPINYKNEGFYVLINFFSNPEFPQELERIYKITEQLLRTIIVKKNKIFQKKTEICDQKQEGSEK
ncbi:MAG: 30S ribosomal protein S6 [Clostridiales bacterium]|nr:30S ribosomal protein S6 [Clostridiales bacterium]